jgi:hypothetical protein
VAVDGWADDARRRASAARRSDRPDQELIARYSGTPITTTETTANTTNATTHSTPNPQRRADSSRGGRSIG